MVESNPKVINFCDRPLVMTACINGKSVTSIVDMWVKYEDGNEEFIEIKYSTDLIKQKSNKSDFHTKILVCRKWVPASCKNRRRYMCKSNFTL
ncbi:Tn7 transposase TnsA N-terminal domain-containing protein [Bacillus cereus]|uniref:Tn7 transposase TnsA N-terminal domain-containing protein n=1 Tax=Bacillus cereus TaxID=1396 RepID=UPI003BF75FAD